VGSANVANYLHTHTNTPSRQTRRLHNVPSGTERYIEGPGRITKLPAPNKPQTWTAGRGTNKMRTKSVSCPIEGGEKPGGKARENQARLMGKIGWFTGHICG